VALEVTAAFSGFFAGAFEAAFAAPLPLLPGVSIVFVVSPK
jgi:hypothetical protein